MFLQKINVNGEDRFYSYDGKGNLYGGFGVLRDYSYKNLPLEMFNADSKLYKYGYNDSGERIKKTETDSARTEYYLRDYLGRELVVYNYETNDPKQVNIYGNGLIGKIGIDTTETRSYYLKDHLGSVRSVVDNNGSVVSAQDYYPYGESLREYNSTLQNLKFSGKQRDNETGYDYSMDRYFINNLGIWNSVERLDNRYYGWSPYSYVLNNPMKFIDPQGTQHEDPNAPEPAFLNIMRQLMNSMRMLIWGSTSNYPQGNSNNSDGNKETYNNNVHDEKTNRHSFTHGIMNNSYKRISGKLGQIVWISIKNVNALGVTINITPTDLILLKQTKQAVLRPLERKEFQFYKFGSEPMGWDFEITSDSDVTVVVYEVESTWVPGMPINK